MKSRKEKQHKQKIKELSVREVEALLHDRKALTARAAGSVLPKVSKALHIVIWVILVITELMQVLALIGISERNARIATGNYPGASSFNSGPLTVAVALMAVFTVWFLFCRGRLRWIPFIATIGVGILFIIVALQMYHSFEIFESASGVQQGLTMAKTVFRHMSPILIPLLMIPTMAVDASLKSTVDMEEQLLLNRIDKSSFEDILPPETKKEKVKKANK